MTGPSKRELQSENEELRRLLEEISNRVDEVLGVEDAEDEESD